MHLAFTDAFLAAQAAVGRDMSRFGPRWGDAYVGEWARSARALGATDLPTTRVGAGRGAGGVRPRAGARAGGPAGRSSPHRRDSAPRSGSSTPGFSGAAALLVSPTIAPLAGVPGRSARALPDRGQLVVTRLQLRAMNLALGGSSPSEQAARWRLGPGPAPDWAA